jgi:3'-phosphoadenosine 5'-phosphosulfate sulfotransferase (PAPS reductase)/FAD synthetase
MIWKDENVKWGNLGRDFWVNQFPHNGTTIDKRKFLRDNHLQYADVPRCEKCRHAFHKCICFNQKEKNRTKRLRKKLELEMHRPFEEKLRESENLVNQVIKEQKGKQIYLAYSGGIDSECCVQLFKDAIAKGLVTVVIGDTLVEFPETRARWAELQKEIPTGKFIIARPERGVSFMSIVRDNGGKFPIYSRGTAKIEDREATKKCCKRLKKDPMHKQTKNADVLILGLRKAENQYRGMIIFRMGNYFHSKALKTWRVYPIAYWTIEDVWKFQKLKGFKYNVIYDKTNCNKTGFFITKSKKIYQIRTGCWCCPQSIHSGYLDWLEEYFPQFRNALNKMGLIQYIIEAKKEKLKELNQQPCGEPL